MTRAKLGSFGIAGVSLGGVGITYGVSTYGWYGLGAIVLKEAGDAAKDTALEGTIGFSPPTSIRGGLKSIRDFIAKVLTPKPGNKHWTDLVPLPKGARRGAIRWEPDGRERRVRQRGQRMTSEGDPFEQLEGVDKAQSRVRKMQRKSNQLDDDIDEEHNAIDMIGKSRGRVKNHLEEIRRDPKCLNEGD